MTTVPVSLAINLENRDATLTKDAKLVNAYVDVSSNEENKSRVVKRPGHDAGTLYEAGAAQGLVTYLGVTRVFVNNKFFKNPTTSVAIDASDEIIDFA